MPRILLLPGDGIGPEVIAAAQSVLERVRPDLEYTEGLIGLAALRECGQPYQPHLLELALEHDAVFLGAVGGEQRPDEDFELRPEAGIMLLRKGLGLYANLRPARAVPALAAHSPLRPDRLEGADLLIVRELTGGLYFGRTGSEDGAAFDTCEYTEVEIERIVRRAFELARLRRRRVTSVDKANVLSTSRLWREVVMRLAAEYSDVEVEHLLVDNAAIQLLQRAPTFDVIVTENLFGDVLSDEASLLAGGLGLMPSASLGDGGTALFEPAHGSAPDIAGQGIANPAAAILSAAMMLRYALGEASAADLLEDAVDATFADGVLTPDLGGDASTEGFTEAVTARLAAR
jgi:3-isopropylmalate dehydrogenase